MVAMTGMGKRTYAHKSPIPRAVPGKAKGKKLSPSMIPRPTIVVLTVM